MRPNYAGSALVNLPVAAMVDTTTMSGFVLLPGHQEPIPANRVIDVLYDDEATEVQQLVTVTLPTIAANTPYGIVAGSNVTEMENNKIGSRPYRAAIDPLTGTAGLDKLAIGEKISRGLNHFLKNYCEAGMRVGITHGATSTPGGFTALEEIVGSTSRFRAIIRTAHATAPTVDIIEGVPADGETITGLTTGYTATAATPVLTTNNGTLCILDKAGYYPAIGSRGGALNVRNGINILPSAVVVTTAAVLGFGMGARLLDDQPVFDTSTQSLATGLMLFPENEDPVAGQLYKRATVVYTKDVSTAVNGVQGATLQYAYVIWYDADAAGAAAFETALDALL